MVIWHRGMGLALLVAAGCSQTTEESELARGVIDPGGGTITSTDSVLTIAIPPGALEESLEFFIERSDDPPEVFGQAYVVRPNPTLRFDATVTYRRELPEETSGLAVGAVDPLEYEDGTGDWVPLPLLRIDTEAKLVAGLDTQISIFYALLDDAAAGGTTATDSSPTVPPTTDPGSTGSGDAAGPEDTAGPGNTTDPGDTTGPTESSGSESAGSESAGVRPVSYAMEVEPILTASCECHTAGMPAGLDLGDGYANLVDVAATEAPLDRIEPGSPADSYLWHKVNGTHLGVGGSDNAMPPPDGGLDAAALETIEAWILDGAEP